MVAFREQNDVVWVAYPTSSTTNINLKHKLLTDNFSPYQAIFFLTLGCVFMTWAVNFGNLPLATLHLELKRLGQRHDSSSSCQWRDRWVWFTSSAQLFPLIWDFRRWSWSHKPVSLTGRSLALCRVERGQLSSCWKMMNRNQHDISICKLVC